MAVVGKDAFLKEQEVRQACFRYLPGSVPTGVRGFMLGAYTDTRLL